MLVILKIFIFNRSISQSAGIAVTVTRGCVGVWDILVGRLISQLADSPLGAIVTHALITPDGKYVKKLQIVDMNIRVAKVVG